jgi:SulP family sulfate permease
LLTFALTVLVDLTTAIEVGMVLSAFLFISRMAAVSQVRAVTGPAKLDASEENGKGDEPETRVVPEGVEIFEMSGPLFFGMSHEFEETMRIIGKTPKIRILHMRHVPIIDATGLKSLQQLHRRNRQSGVRLLLAGVQKEPLRALCDSGLALSIGEENICFDMDAALERAIHLLKKET